MRTEPKFSETWCLLCGSSMAEHQNGPLELEKWCLNKACGLGLRYSTSLGFGPCYWIPHIHLPDNGWRICPDNCLLILHEEPA